MKRERQIYNALMRAIKEGCVLQLVRLAMAIACGWINALPTDPSDQCDQTHQPPDTATDQHGGLRRTTESIGAAGRG
jgi:hypothetical protein